MDWRTIDVDRKQVGSDSKTVRMKLEKIGVDLKMIGMDQKRIRLDSKTIEDLQAALAQLRRLKEGNLHDRSRAKDWSHVRFFGIP